MMNNNLINTVCQILEKYGKEMDEILECGKKLISQINESDILERPRENLREVKDARILPISCCRYLT